MSNLMKNSVNGESSGHEFPKFSKNVPFCSIWNANRTFLAAELLLFTLFGYHGNSYSCDLYQKWAQLGNHIIISHLFFSIIINTI